LRINAYHQTDSPIFCRGVGKMEKVEASDDKFEAETEKGKTNLLKSRSWSKTTTTRDCNRDTDDEKATGFCGIADVANAVGVERESVDSG
jgi:hypothetical protein